MKKIFLLGLALFAGGSIVAVVLSQTIKKEEFKSVQQYFNTYSNLDEADAVDYNFDENFSFPDATGLELNLVFGEVEISQSKDDQLHVSLKSKIHKDMKPLDTQKIIYRDGSQIHINFMDLFDDKKGSSRFLKVDDHSIIISNALTLKIAIPQNFKSFNIDTVSADYKIAGLNLDKLNINNVSGDFRLDYVTVASSLINTVSGDLEFDELQFETVKLDTVSGDAVFKFSAPTDLGADITSISGDIDGDEFFKKHIALNSLKLGEPKKKISINSISGDIEFVKK
jgi:Putative adhesin